MCNIEKLEGTGNEAINKKANKLCCTTHLKVANIDTVKSDESCEQTDIRLGEGGASEVALTGQNLFNPVKSSKHFSHCFVVGLLLGRKTSTIHPIVDVPNMYSVYGRFILRVPNL